MQVAGIAAGKSHTAKVVQSLHVVEICIDMVAETIVVFCRMTYDAVLDIIILNIAPNDWHLTHIHYLEEFLLFARRLRHTEGGFNVALKTETLGYTIGGNSKSTVYLWREFPSEH